MVRSTIIFNRNCGRNYECLYKEPNFLNLEVKFVWFTVGMNLIVCTILAITICVAAQTLKRLFASTFQREIQQITLIMYTFSICFLLRTAYEAYENVRNSNLQDLPSQFYGDMETTILYLFFVDGPIAIILYLHHINSSPQKPRNRLQN